MSAGMYFLFAGKDEMFQPAMNRYQGVFGSLESAKQAADTASLIWAQIAALTRDGLELIAEYADGFGVSGIDNSGWTYRGVVPVESILLTSGTPVREWTFNGEKVVGEKATHACAPATPGVEGWGWVDFIIENDLGRAVRDTIHGGVLTQRKFGMISWTPRDATPQPRGS